MAGIIFRGSFAGAIALGAATFATPALATPNFPPEVEKHLMLDYVPECTLCHVGTENATTVKTPFGKSILAAGAEPNDIASLDMALDTLAKDNTDSDGDGIPDITELKDDTDPNVAGVSTPLVYGCFAKAELAGQSSAPWGAAVFTVLGLAFVMRRRR